MCYLVLQNPIVTYASEEKCPLACLKIIGVKGEKGSGEPIVNDTSHYQNEYETAKCLKDVALLARNATDLINEIMRSLPVEALSDLKSVFNMTVKTVCSERTEEQITDGIAVYMDVMYRLICAYWCCIIITGAVVVFIVKRRRNRKGIKENKDIFDEENYYKTGNSIIEEEKHFYDKLIFLSPLAE